MKKFFVLLFVLVLSASFAAAEDASISVEADFGIDDINKPDDAEIGPWADASISYTKSFLDGALSFYTDLTYSYYFTNADDLSLDSNLRLTYNRSLGSASKLALELNHEAYYTLAPTKPVENNPFTGTLTPRIRFTQTFGFGSIYAQVTTPIKYINEDEKDAEIPVNLRSRLAWNSTFGLGIWAQLYSKLGPTSVRDLYDGVGVNISYDTDSFYFELFTRIPKKLGSGITITPEFDYYFKDFTFLIGGDIGGIAADEGSVSISPWIGVSFDF
jgi:hypothetical protein